MVACSVFSANSCNFIKAYVTGRWSARGPSLAPIWTMSELCSLHSLPMVSVLLGATLSIAGPRWLSARCPDNGFLALRPSFPSKEITSFRAIFGTCVLNVDVAEDNKDLHAQPTECRTVAHPYVSSLGLLCNV